MTALRSFSAASAAPPFQTCGEKLGLDWFRFPTDSPRPMPYALFHTIRDMMTVILRIDAKSISNPLPQAGNVFTSLSDLFSINFSSTTLTSAIGTVWHTGCLKYRCEGLRVLGTWIKPGWGLGIPEIGRTGIFSPRKFLQTRQSGNPQQKPREIRGK
jgi:hypothetical protein